MSRARNLALAGALLVALAALFATPALYVPGFAALLLSGAAPAWVHWTAARAKVALRAGAVTVREGESVSLRVIVSRGLIPFPRATLLPLPGAGAVALPARRDGEIALSAVASRRGRQALGPARLRVFDPLGICVRELVSAERELLVLPRVYPVSARALDGLGGQRRSPDAAALEIDSLRPYGTGGAATRIHWPTVARTGVLMERGFTTEADPRVLVVLDAQRPDSEEALDEALRATASLCVHLARQGGCALLLPDDRRASLIGPDLRCWPALHERLALVRPGTGAPLAPRRAHARTLVYVTASAADAPARSGRCYRVGPLPLAGLGVAFTVAGCSGQIVNDRTQAASG